jgi:hypothetical protein
LLAVGNTPNSAVLSVLYQHPANFSTLDTFTGSLVTLMLWFNHKERSKESCKVSHFLPTCCLLMRTSCPEPIPRPNGHFCGVTSNGREG